VQTRRSAVPALRHRRGHEGTGRAETLLVSVLPTTLGVQVYGPRAAAAWPPGRCRLAPGPPPLGPRAAAQQARRNAPAGGSGAKPRSICRTGKVVDSVTELFRRKPATTPKMRGRSL